MIVTNRSGFDYESEQYIENMIAQLEKLVELYESNGKADLLFKKRNKLEWYRSKLKYVIAHKKAKKPTGYVRFDAEKIMALKSNIEKSTTELMEVLGASRSAINRLKKTIS